MLKKKKETSYFFKVSGSTLILQSIAHQKKNEADNWDRLVIKKWNSNFHNDKKNLIFHNSLSEALK